MSAPANMHSRIRPDGHALSSGWIPFDMPEESRYIVLPVRLNKIVIEALLDSAVQATAVHQTLAPQLGLRAQGTFTAIGVSGFATGVRAQGLTVEIGDAAMTVAEPKIVDLAALHLATSRPIVAILGQDVFDRFVVDIDFGSRRIAFVQPAVFAASQGSIALPLSKQAFGRRTIPLSIEGQPPIPAVIDLGSDAPLCLSRDYVRRLGLFRGKRTSTSLSAGVEGLEENEVGVLDTATAGPTLMHDVPVEVPQRWTHDVPAIVGVPMLSRFRLAVDFAAGLIWMLPHADAETRPFKKDRLGFAAIPKGDYLHVIHISPNSPAERAGLKIGDDIVAVDGQNVDAQYLKNRRRQGMRPAGTVLPLQLRGGHKITVTLADYF